MAPDSELELHSAENLGIHGTHGETTDLRWVEPQVALELAASGEILLPPPQVREYWESITWASTSVELPQWYLLHSLSRDAPTRDHLQTCAWLNFGNKVPFIKPMLVINE